MRTEVRAGVAVIVTMAMAGLTAVAAPPAELGKSAAAPTAAKPAAPAAKPAAPSAAQAERGKYLVTILACGDCHTPFKMGPAGPEPDMTRMLSGHPESLPMPAPPKLPEGPWVWVGAGTNTAFAGPWGISYAINLTPDPVTGLGPWTEEMFVRALKQGKHWGESRTILPPMPWPALSRMTDADLKAIWAYLRTLPAIRNNVPASEPAGPPPAGK